MYLVRTFSELFISINQDHLFYNDLIIQHVLVSYQTLMNNSGLFGRDYRAIISLRNNCEISQEMRLLVECY